jgi:hypothetical protein
LACIYDWTQRCRLPSGLLGAADVAALNFSIAFTQMPFWVHIEYVFSLGSIF